MRVLHLASWYPNVAGVQDGDFIQRHLQSIAAIMPVEVIYVGKNDHQKAAISTSTISRGNLTETIVYYKPLKTGIRLIDKLASLRAYREAFRQAINDYIARNGKPDLVHVHVAMRAGLLALWLKRGLGIPFLVTEHWSGYYRADPDNYFVRDKFFRHYTAKILKQALWVTAVSGDLAKQLSEIFAISNVSVMFNVVNTSLFRYKAMVADVGTGEPEAKAGSKVEPVQKNVFRFIHVSNMHPIKNLDGIFRVLSRLNGARRDWTLTLVGQIEPRYTQLAIDLAIDKQIEWKGLVEHHAVSAELQQANLLLMFSHHENLSCVVCESLCCGVPVVASRVGGLAEIIDATNGMLCSAGDEEALLTLILAAMENYGRFDQAKIATKAAGLFDESLIAHKFISLYHQLLSRK